MLFFFFNLQCLKKCVTNFPIFFFVCLIFYFILLGFVLDFFFHLFSPPWNLETQFQGLDFAACVQIILCQVHFMLSLAYVSFSHASCPALLWLHAAVLFCLFVFKIVSSHTLCILLYSAPLSLRATDVANGNANGGRNNVLSSTVSRPVPHSTSPSPGCAAGDQGKENLSVHIF